MNSEETNSLKDESLIDYYLSTHKLSSFQFRVIIANSLIMLMDGIHMTFISTTIFSLKSKFNITNFDLSLISSVIFFLVGIGSFISGKPFINNHKKFYVKLSFGLLLISACLMTFISHILVFAICRVVQGISVGVAIPIGITTLCETMPIAQRSNMIILTSASFLVGACLNCILAYIILPENLDGEDINKLFFVISIISLLSYVYMSKYFEESPRSYFMIGKTEKGFAVMEEIIQDSLSSTDRETILQQISKSNSSISSEIASLFSDDYKKITILLIFANCAHSMITYGCTFIMSITLKRIKEDHFTESTMTIPTNSTISFTDSNQFLGVDSDQKINSILIEQITVYLFSLPSMFIAGYLTESKFFGRKYTMSLGYFCTLLFILIGFFNLEYFFYFFGIAGFFLTFSFQASSSYSCEVYPSKIRNLGVGFITLFVRIAGFASQPISVVLTNINYLGMFYFAVVLCILGFSCSVGLPYDTKGMALDSIPILNSAQHQKMSEEKEVESTKESQV